MRCSMNTDSFKKLCKNLPMAVAYLDRVWNEYAPVWGQVGSAAKVFKRWLIDMESELWSTFEAGLSRAGGNVADIEFAESDPSSEFAAVLGRLKEHSDERKENIKKIIAEDKQREQSATGVVAEGPAADCEAAAPKASGAPEAAAPQVSGGVASQHAAIQEKHFEKERKQASLEARVRMDDVLHLFQSLPRQGCPKPAALVAASAERGTLYIVPPSTYKRGEAQSTAKHMQVRKWHALEWAGPDDSVAVCLGEDESLRVQTRDALVISFPNLAQYTWSRSLMPALQEEGSKVGKGLVEFFLVGTGAAHRGKAGQLFPQWILNTPPTVEKKHRLACCCTPQTCPVSSWARRRFLQPLPQSAGPSAPRSQLAAIKAAADPDNLFGEGMENQAVDDKESSDSEGPSADDSESAGSEKVVDEVKGSAEDAAEPVLVRMSRGKAWTKANRNGMHPDLWLQLFNSINPGAVVSVRPIQWQGGLLMAALTFNDQRLAISQTPLFGFHPGADLDPNGKKANEISAHVADHVLAMVTAHYKNFYEVTKTTRRRTLHRQPSQPDSRAATSSAGHVGAKLFFISVPTNSAANPLQVTEKSAADSDTEACGGDSKDLDFNVLSRRNRTALARHGLQFKMSPAKCSPGNGLFTTTAVPAGLRVPVKGPWFMDNAALQSWLRGLHPATSQQMQNRIIEVMCKTGGEVGDACQRAKPIYKVATNIVGFVNDHHKITRSPNAVLELNPDIPLGEHTLYLKTTSAINADSEILLNYGPKSEFAKRVRPERGAPKATRKRGRDSEKVAQAGVASAAASTTAAAAPTSAEAAEAAAPAAGPLSAAGA